MEGTDPYVIALNTYKTSFAQFDHQHAPGHIPLVAKALFGYGETVLLSFFPRDGRSAQISSDRFDYIYRRHLEVKKEKRVPTNLFFLEEYSGISALILSKEGFWTWTHRIPIPLSENFIVVHNPFARNPLTNGWLKSGTRFGSSRVNYISESGKMEVNISKRAFHLPLWSASWKMADETISEFPMSMLSYSPPTENLSSSEWSSA